MDFYTEDIERFIKQLSDNNWKERKEASRALGKLVDKSAGQPPRPWTS